MALQWKKNSRYPSVTRPGVFPRIQDFDAEGNDLLEDTWFDLTGINEEEINKFKFALGTWTHISRRNRKIRVLSADAVSTVTYPITSDEDGGTTEPKPDYEPEGFLDGKTPYQWAKDNSDNALNVLDPGEKSSQVTKTSGAGSGFDYDVRQLDNTIKELEFGNAPNLERHNRIIWYNYTYWTINYRIPFSKRGIHDVKVGMKTQDYAWICYATEANTLVYGTDYRYKWKPNFADEHWADDNKLGTPSPGFQWVWQPTNNIKKITDPDTGLKSYGEWVEGGSLVVTENQANSDNQYVGLVTKTNKDNISDIEQDDLFLYHELDSDDYKEISAPLEVYFSLNYLERDNDPLRSLDVVKYQVLEWGDEEEQMSDENILESEFLYLYESDDAVFDAAKYKKLCLIASEAQLLEPGTVDISIEDNPRGKLHTHVYIEPGIKTIKTIVMRFDETGTFLLETSIVYTNIFVADPNQKIQDFNIFGAQDYSVLPLEKELEPIIGNIDKRSEYVRSIEKIKNNDLFETSDYLEKLYTDDFLPKVNNDLYGKYAGNIDLGITRVFKKPYNIFDFIGGDALEIINNNFEYPQDSLPLNSSATEILISNEDCVVELNPSNQNNAQIENTALSDEKGVLMGDYRLVKNPEQEIRRDSSMAIPKINTQKKRQAF